MTGAPRERPCVSTSGVAELAHLPLWNENMLN